jgi:P27 family predicted phage terminase small subunit
MGLRGPAPKPTALKLLNGKAPNAREPKPERVAPQMPKHLDKDAQKEWKRLSSMLLRIGVLTEADGMTLACLCQAWSTMVKAQKKLSETGMLLKTPSGYIQQSPLVSIINNCADTVTKLSREFGLTPAARTRITVAKEENAGQGLTARSIIEIARRRSSGLA